MMRSLSFPATLTVLLLLLLFGTGCETRDRSNPFDPENPQTGGRPRVLNAIAGDGSVLLTWELDGFDDPQGLRLSREVEGARTLLLEQAEVSRGEFVDTPLTNEVDLRYYLEVQGPDGVWLETEPDEATPGVTRAWVGDAVGGGLRRISPDGRDILSRISSGDFLDMAVESVGTVWAPNWSQGEILELDAEGAITQRINHVGGNAIAVDRISRAIWVGSFRIGSLVRYDRAGNQVLLFEGAGPVEDLEAARGGNGGVWVAARFEGVFLFFDNKVQDRWPQFAWPVSVTEDASGILWVVDRTSQKVSRIVISTGRVVESPAVLGDPVDGSLDGQGGFWVADRGRRGLVHLDADGTEIGFLAIGEVTGVTWDSRRHRLWVIFREEGRVATLTPGGEQVSSIVVGGRPVKVEGNWP